MEIKKIGSRGTLFTFYDLGISTNIYVINAKQHVFVMDTYLGPDIMQEVDSFLRKEYEDKQVIIVNSHSHWDHVWGNSFYSSAIIISHVLCKKFMEQQGEKELQKHGEYRKGPVVLKYPNLTFTDKIIFEEDGVLIYHTPGHTADEISVIDMVDKVLFAGDNLERPIPYIMWKDLDRYIKTLEEYLNVDAQFIIGGHTACEDKELIRNNLEYVKKLDIGNAAEFEKGEYAEYHNTNMEWLSKA